MPYPENIMKPLREMAGFDEADTTHDAELLISSPAEALDAYLSYHGHGLSVYALIGLIKDTYGYSLDASEQEPLFYAHYEAVKNVTDIHPLTAESKAKTVVDVYVQAGKVQLWGWGTIATYQPEQGNTMPDLIAQILDNLRTQGFAITVTHDIGYCNHSQFDSHYTPEAGNRSPQEIVTLPVPWFFTMCRINRHGENVARETGVIWASTKDEATAAAWEQVNHSERCYNLKITKINPADGHKHTVYRSEI